MEKKKTKQTKKPDLLRDEITEIINDHSEEVVTLFNQHKLLLEKANRNLAVCKQQERDKIEQGYTWVHIDNKTKVLRKMK